jgi:type I restriction enzyme, S subunit
MELGKVADFYAGTTLPNGEPFRGQKDGVLLVKVSDMNLPGNETELLTCQLWSPIAGTNAATCPKGTVIFPKRGGAIGTNKKRLTVRASVLDPNLMGVVGRPEHLETSFLFHWFLHFDLTTLISGSSVPQLNKRDLAPLKIALPPVERQREFSHHLQRVEKIRASQQAALAKTHTLFVSIQHRAFNGELTSASTPRDAELQLAG